MAIMKSELYGSLWQIFDELRGGMDASQYKDYVLTLLFVKYVSDKAAIDSNAMITVPKGDSFSDIAALVGDMAIGDKINRVIDRLAEENDLHGVIDVADFSDENKLGRGTELVDRLIHLVALFDSIEFDFTDEDRSPGRVFEELMQQFSIKDGKKGGVAYTPAEISQLMVGLLGIEPSAVGVGPSIYDPTCGSGSLLINAFKAAGNNALIYGQEINIAAYASARMNMILNDVDASIAFGDVFSEPQFLNGDELQQFDFVVGAPPFLIRGWDRGIDSSHDCFNRFSFGVPPSNQGDYAFIQHMIASLKPTGRMAVLVSHGTLFRGGSEGAIRKSIMEADLVEAVIGLPPNLLPGIGIPVCLLVCNKRKPEARAEKVLFINADRDYVRNGRKNVLLPEHIEKITRAFEEYTEVERFSRVVDMVEMRDNEFNLNIPRYVDTSELAVLLKQHCSQLKKCQIKDLALEVNQWSMRRPFENKPNALFISRVIAKMRPPMVDISSIDEKKQRDYYQVVLNDKAVNHYVVQFLCSTIGRHALSALAQGSITPLINRESLGEVIIALPSLKQQKASVETHNKLSTLKESIEIIRRDLSLNPTNSAEFDQQLNSMLMVMGKLSDADQIRHIIRQGESKTVEFKETYSLCLRKKTKENYVEESALKTIVAFLNSEGGTLLIGVSDEPQVVGIERELEMFHKNNEDNFLKHLKNKLKTRIGEQFYPFIDYAIVVVNGIKLVRFCCIRAEKPCFLDGTSLYVRTNPATDKLEGQKQYEYIQNHFNK